MDTEESPGYAALLSELGGADWVSVLEGVGTAEAWLRAAAPGDHRAHDLVSRLVMLAQHSKWEIRRAVANSAAQTLHPAFEPVLAKLAIDDNARVRQAAGSAALRRRDWQNASTLGKQHEGRINAILDDIEARFGTRGRDAVRRASEQIADTFSRELYHEIIKLLSPLSMSADRLRTQLSDETTTRAELEGEALRIGRRVIHLRTVLDAMRAYTAQPALTYSSEILKDIVEEAASLVVDSEMPKLQSSISVKINASLRVEVSRSRFVQAIVNVLQNAVESYDASSSSKPILVSAIVKDGCASILIEDNGCGMSEESLKDARVLFATSKPSGTGFGLPLAIKIIESEHGGRLNLESSRGRGTVVSLLIPQQRQGDSHE